MDNGENFACSLVPDPVNSWADTYCWGAQLDGTLGNGSTSGNNVTPQLFGDTGAGPFAAFQNSLDPIIHVLTYAVDTCVVTESALVYCAGKHSGNNPQTIIMDFDND